MATGVLIVGLGKGTKSLKEFLGCTKTYEATILFGAATDTYDMLGKVLSRAAYDYLTQDEVEKALTKFRGKIMQKPPLYSALHVQGKRLYEYAREGKEVPVEIEERSVEVHDIRIVEWLPGGSHNYRWPEQEPEREDKLVAEKVLHLDQRPEFSTEADSTEGVQELSTGKRKRSMGDHVVSSRQDAPAAKRQETGNLLLMSGALQSPEETKLESKDCQAAVAENATGSEQENAPSDTPPAVRLRMTVTSGFYVRSLAHDLGKAVGSLGCMSELVRIRQGEFELGLNVLEWEVISKGENFWAPDLKAMLKNWHSKTETSQQEFGEPSSNSQLLLS